MTVKEDQSEVNPVWQAYLESKREQQTLTLTSIRDTLLPKLLSGETRIKDAEKVVEEVV